MTLDVLEEEMDPTPPQVYALRQEIQLCIDELEYWDILKEKMLLDHKMVEKKKDFRKWKTRSLEHQIALYICALTHQVREGALDQLTIRLRKLEKTGYI